MTPEEERLGRLWVEQLRKWGHRATMEDYVAYRKERDAMPDEEKEDIDRTILSLCSLTERQKREYK